LKARESPNRPFLLFKRATGISLRYTRHFVASIQRLKVVHELESPPTTTICASSQNNVPPSCKSERAVRQRPGHRFSFGRLAREQTLLTQLADFDAMTIPLSFGLVQAPAVDELCFPLFRCLVCAIGAPLERKCVVCKRRPIALPLRDLDIDAKPVETKSRTLANPLCG
jgi:hypothetical protein